MTNLKRTSQVAPRLAAGAFVAAALICGGTLRAQEHPGGGHPEGGHAEGGHPEGGHPGGPPQGGHPQPMRAPQAMMHPPEPHAGPSGYQRPAESQGWNARPATVDRQTYQHNYQAARVYHVGPYHRPSGWVNRRWGYGEVLPRGFWASQYLLADYWLFGLEVPPGGYEWVRVGNDALLVSTVNGEILQAEYGVFG